MALQGERRDVSGSFRDPSGVVFERNGTIYRVVRLAYKSHYDRLIDSGLYQALVDARLLVPHEEVPLDSGASPDAYKVIRPERVPFISYPFEWCFSQLKAAALTTLRIQGLALEYGLTLKDASAYNIQFRTGLPVLIDTLSFEPYIEGAPWVAYRQFCQHFLAPLALMAYRDVRLGRLHQLYMDGVPLDLAVSLLPRWTLLKPALLLHLHLHAWSQRRYSERVQQVDVKGRRVARNALLGLLDSLTSGVQGLKWRPKGTEWADYCTGDSYDEEALQHKIATVKSFLATVKPSSVWDIGANTGLFSQIAARMKVQTVAFDIDPAAVEKNYLACVEQSERLILPLLMDLTNPSPGLGWAHSERMSLLERGPTGMVLALALVHHLAISNNLPLGRIAAFFAGLSPWLAIEFTPKEDPKVQQLLASREDIFPEYTQAGFEAAFNAHYTIEATEPLQHSQRILYLMRRKR
ncbi:MAG: SAM-dependent methyltransferase [Chloroflexi bacterium]|nr:SAM-dependent methyltransferase [Chloroflexota bacterium]